MISSIYQIKWNISHLQDTSHDIKIVPFNGYENTVTLSSKNIYELPEIIQFNSFLPFIKNKNDVLDYPSNNMSWPIMSERMFNILLEIGQFNYKVIPIKLIENQSYKIKEQISSYDIPLNYLVVQLLEHQDYFDNVNSIYTPHPRLPNLVKKISKLVVTLPNNIPPLFRLKICPNPLFISNEAKRALEDANIKGVQFIPLEDFTY